MALDNYLLLNNHLKSLSLVAVKMNVDSLREISGTLSELPLLRKLDFSNNYLREGGCREVSQIIYSSRSLQKVILDNNESGEEGLVTILKAALEYKSLTKLSYQFNRFVVTTELLAYLGNQVLFKNPALKILLLTGFGPHVTASGS